MGEKKDQLYRELIARLKILEFQSQKTIEDMNNEKLKSEMQELREVIKKMECIRKRKYLAILGDSNQESMLYEAMTNEIYEQYKNIEIDDTKGLNLAAKRSYKAVKEQVKDYQLIRQEDKEEER